MFKNNKKLAKEDLVELRAKVQLIKQHQAIVQALEMQKSAWLVSLFSKYGLDGNKEWSFDLKNGEIEEAKPKEGGEQ